MHLNRRMRTPEELDEPGDDAALDDLFDRRVALLGEQLAELGRRVNLLVDRVGEDALDHDGELLLQLPERRQRRTPR